MPATMPATKPTGITYNNNRLLAVDALGLLSMTKDPVQAMLIALTILKMAEQHRNGKLFPDESLRADLLRDTGLTHFIDYNILQVTDPATCVVVTGLGQHAFTLQSLFPYMASAKARHGSPGAVQGVYSARTMALLLSLREYEQTEEIRGLVDAARVVATPQAMHDGRIVLAERARAASAQRLRFSRNAFSAAVIAIPAILGLGFVYMIFDSYQARQRCVQSVDLVAQGDTHQVLANMQERDNQSLLAELLPVALVLILLMIAGSVFEFIRRGMWRRQQRAEDYARLFDRLRPKLTELSQAVTGRVITGT